MKLKEKFEFSKHSITINWDNGNQSLTFNWWRGIRKQNKIEFPDDPDINSKPMWGKRHNGAIRGHDCCLDCSLDLGHLEINYMNFKYNTYKVKRKLRDRYGKTNSRNISRS